MSLETEILNRIGTEFKGAFDRIENAVRQLDDSQIWHRPSSKSNSIGIILQHLTGNLRQWVGEALGGREYNRNRPLEFEETHRKPKAEMLKDFAAVGAMVQEVVPKIPADSFLTPRRIQNSSETVFSALLHAVTHMNLHSGQITYIAKLLLNEKYTEAGWHSNP